jgi:hypothetical protein
MNWAWRGCLNLSFVIIPAALPATVEPKTLLITVRTYNLANAPTKDLEQASQVAGEIFKQAGIEVRWLNCALSLEEARTNRACEEAIGRRDLDVVVTTASITRPGMATDSSLGFASPLAPSSHVVVLWDRSKKMAESSGVPAGILLGHAMPTNLDTCCCTPWSTPGWASCGRGGEKKIYSVPKMAGCCSQRSKQPQ